MPLCLITCITLRGIINIVFIKKNKKKIVSKDVNQCDGGAAWLGPTLLTPLLLRQPWKFAV